VYGLVGIYCGLIWQLQLQSWWWLLSGLGGPGWWFGGSWTDSLPVPTSDFAISALMGRSRTIGADNEMAKSLVGTGREPVQEPPNHHPGPPKPESSHHQDWSRSCQIKPQYMPTSPYTVFIHKPSIQRNCICVRCCISFGICCRLYWGDQVIEYKYVVNLHWGLSLRDLSVFFSFWNFYLNNASSVGQTRCHRSNHLCLSVSSSTQQPMFESMEPAKYIFHHHQAMFYIW
jgi:hypothetical protein